MGFEIVLIKVLIFVPSRRLTRTLAVDLLTYALADRQENRFLHMNPDEEPFQSIVNRLNDEHLKETIKRGVGFLHEGTSLQDSESVQNLFNSGAIQVKFIIKINHILALGNYELAFNENKFFHQFKNNFVTKILY
jgi:hypothetical protein